MSKLYVFGIGGTGARVLRSLTMLLSAGVECGVDTIVPIIIDRDRGNGDYTRTDDLIKKYISIYNIAPKHDETNNIKNRFFNTEIKLLGNDELLLPLNDQSMSFKNFIGYSTQTLKNQALSAMLFSKNTLEMDIEYGFRGNPNIGSVVLNQFNEQDVFRSFASDFQVGDKIFIISSIFGGTGASGFPLLRKMLQTPNLRDASGRVLPNWGLINTAPIGAISVLPYFNVNNNVSVNSDTFNDKARAALSYYETEDGKLDTLYYIADARRKTYEYAEGGEQQKNDAHFVELAAAMSILDFVNPDKQSENFLRDGGGRRKTVYKEFGINSDVREISFADLAAETQKLLVNPLSRFMLFAKYMGHTIVKKNENGRDRFVAENVRQYDIFYKESKYQPYAHGRFVGDFRNKITALETVQDLFLDWLQEMAQQDRKFSPFNLTTPDAFNFVNGKISLFKNKKFGYKNWEKVDNEVNRLISEINSPLTDIEKFIELFYRATEALIDQTTQNNGGGENKYIFRLQSEGDFGLENTIEHWGISKMYGEKQRNAIGSSNINSYSQPTSIPSPFARIALVKTAFSEVATYGENALRAYQKIVSDTLDVAEIFFTLDKWKDKVEIITWKYGRKENSPELEDDSDLKKLHSGHGQIYKTLKTFLENDAVAYNFDKMKNIYILKYKRTGDMIGATSPCTLFFSSANNYNDIDIMLNSQRRAFEGIVPLSQRNWSFQKYLYSWIAQFNENRNVDGRDISIFDEFIKYLEAQKPLINRTAEIDALTSVDTNIFIQLRSPDVEVLGKPLYQNKNFGHEIWTANDILEDTLIRIPFKINKDSFFDGNMPDGSTQTYLLPIKEKFFTEYTVEDLKRFIRINHSGDVATVKIEIDTQTIEKQYKKSNNTLIDLTFDCAIFPNVKFSNENLANYRFGLVCDFREKDKFDVEFVKINSNIEQTMRRFSVRNETHSLNRQLKNYSLEGSIFNYIKITYEGKSGIIIPNMEEGKGSSKFTFAIDFGTTNTHIEYRIDNNNVSKSFDIKKLPIDEKQIHYLHGGEDLLKNYFDEEYIPSYTDEEFMFPMRTALSYGENINWLNVYPFEKASLNVLYEKRIDYPYNKTETDLKWSDEQDYRNKVKAYIESIMYILRNKVILNHGNLADTKIIWFYPVSMERRRYGNLVTVWNEAYKKYFGGNESNIISITESIAPFEYYIKDGDTSKLVTIDIGGETTDVVISIDGNADYITSFRFAANAVFGDGYSENHRVKNGIVTQFSNQIRKDLKTVITNEEDEIFRIFDDMIINKRSDDIVSFLFSLKYNRRVRAFGENFANNVNLNDKLISDTTQKITFIFFYSAIIYHIAKLMKALNTEMPDKIVFSGNGSRVIHFLTTDNKILQDYTKLIFEKVFGKEYPNRELTIIPPGENPKVATCKGGFYLSQPYDYESILNKKVVLHSNSTNQIIQIKNSTNSDKYKAINDDYLKKTVEEVEKFINFVFENLHFFTDKGYKLNDGSINIARRICTQNLYNYAKEGWKLKSKEIQNDEIINESLFFYPLVGMLKELTVAICNNNINNQTH